MELVEGETLEQRLMRGQLTTDQTLRYAAQIADALSKAHAKGFTHRDLKPANIMLTKTGAKLMDFGLAKHSGSAPLSSALTEMTMEQAKLTSEGMLIGTFQYMAPEQLEGKEADPRTDIFALGEVIYEMATGKPPFAGRSRASLVAAILTSEPQPMAALRPMTPPALERVVKKCLAKDPEERWQSASDLASELKWIAEGESAAGGAAKVSVSHSRWERASWPLAALCLLLAMVAGAAWWNASGRGLSPMYFHASVPFAATDLALSPDGKTLALVAYSDQANAFMLWTHAVGSRRTTLLEGTAGAAYPFWSPDGKSIGFFADSKLRKIDASGGPVQVVCDAPNGRGGAWNKDGVIIFAPEALGPLFRVPSGGGTPTELTKLDLSRSEAGHRWPVFLPDGKQFLYMAANFSGRPGINAIFVGSLDSTEKDFVVSTNANATYAQPGYLLYLRDRTLVAQAFDLRRFQLSGEPHTLSDEVLYFPQVYRLVFDVSGGGVLVTQAGKGVYQSQLRWFDRSGKQVGTVGRTAWYDNLQLSPDGRRVATDQTDPDGRNVDVWVLDPARDATARLTFDPALDMTPVWSPDGKQLVTSSNRSLIFRLYLKNADGSGSDEEIAAGSTAQFSALDWSRDGKNILVRETNELWYLTWPERTLKPLLQPKWVVRSAQFSPDGRWIAYSSNESGGMEIYVSPFPNMTSKWQVSSGGGQEPRWRRDGKELFYLSPDGKMMAVPIIAGASFESGSPVTLFQTHRRQPIASFDLFSYDVSPDGQRFLITTKLDEAETAPLSVLLNWASDMEK
jgi:Tol biopolymer transport system component